MRESEGIRLQLNEVEVRRGSTRQTPLTGFGEQLRNGAQATGSLVGKVAATAGYSVPAAAVLGAAVNGAGALSDAGGFATAAPGGGGLGGGAADAVAQRAAGGDRSAELLVATQQMQELNQQFNLQMLQVQEHFQRDSREFTLISNAMKVKHDTARNAVSNLK